ncbi:MAG: hypothetical protein ACTSVV_18675 [Promethearchaeota archaeon]
MKDILYYTYLELISKNRIIHFWMFLCLITTIVILVKSWRFRKLKWGDIPIEERYIIFTWIFGSLWWFFNGLGLSLYSYYPPIGFFVIQVAGACLIFHLYWFLPILLRYIFPTRKKILWAEILIGIGWLCSMWYYWTRAKLIFKPIVSALNKSDFYFIPISKPLPEILIGTLDGIFIVLVLFILNVNFKRKKFNFKNLSSFYLFYSILLYSALFLLNLLFARTIYFIYLSFILIPILTYLSYKEEIRFKYYLLKKLSLS